MLIPPPARTQHTTPTESEPYIIEKVCHIAFNYFYIRLLINWTGNIAGKWLLRKKALIVITYVCGCFSPFKHHCNCDSTIPL